MSIIISNVSEKYSRKGLQTYEIRLNKILLADNIGHLSEDGMSTLLRKCADALDNVDIDSKIRQERYKEFYNLIKGVGYERED